MLDLLVMSFSVQSLLAAGKPEAPPGAGTPAPHFGGLGGVEEVVSALVLRDSLVYPLEVEYSAWRSRRVASLSEARSVSCDLNDSVADARGVWYLDDPARKVDVVRREIDGQFSRVQISTRGGSVVRVDEPHDGSEGDITRAYVTDGEGSHRDLENPDLLGFTGLFWAGTPIGEMLGYFSSVEQFFPSEGAPGSPVVFLQADQSTGAAGVEPKPLVFEVNMETLLLERVVMYNPVAGAGLVDPQDVVRYGGMEYVPLIEVELLESVERGGLCVPSLTRVIVYSRGGYVATHLATDFYPGMSPRGSWGEDFDITPPSGALVHDIVSGQTSLQLSEGATHLSASQVRNLELYASFRRAAGNPVLGFSEVDLQGASAGVSCGAHSVWTLLGLGDREIGVGDVQALLEGRGAGSVASFQDLIQVASVYGVAVAGFSLGGSDVRSLGAPFLAALTGPQWPDGHFCVAMPTGDGVLAYSGPDTLQLYSYDAFGDVFSGSYLIPRFGSVRIGLSSGPGVRVGLWAALLGVCSVLAAAFYFFKRLSVARAAVVGQESL